MHFSAHAPYWYILMLTRFVQSCRDGLVASRCALGCHGPGGLKSILDVSNTFAALTSSSGIEVYHYSSIGLRTYRGKGNLQSPSRLRPDFTSDMGQSLEKQNQDGGDRYNDRVSRSLITPNAGQVTARTTDQRTPIVHDVTSSTIDRMHESTTGEDSDLARALRSSYVRSSSGENAVFIPVDKIEALICPLNVCLQLAISTTLNRAARDECAAEVCGSPDTRKNRKRIFAILALVDMVAEIAGFIAADICDSDLPLELQHHPRGSETTQCLVLRRNGHQPDFMGYWKPSAKELFDHNQWIVNAPCLSIGLKGVLHYDLAQQTILPFIQGDEPQEIRRGSFSIVFKAEVHPAHHNFNEYGNNAVAIKQLHASSEDAFNRELQTLKSFSGNGQGTSHLIKLLATFKHRGSYHFVLPWAEGDLQSSWKQPHDFPVCTSWVSEQVHGLATPLHRMHHPVTNNTAGERPYGRHGDIKPANILWLKGYSNNKPPGLVLDDYGLTDSHRAVCRSNVNPHTIGGTQNDLRLFCVAIEFAARWLRDSLSMITPSMKRTYVSNGTSIARPSRKRLRMDHVVAYGCPYRKRDPLVFNVRDFPSCALTKFPSIPMVKRHVLKDHQNAAASGNITDQLCHHGVEATMEKAREAEIGQRLRSRRANDQVLDWDSLWNVLFPADMDIPIGEYEPVIEHHEVNKKLGGRAFQGKDLFLRKMNGIHSCTSTLDLEVQADDVWDTVKSYTQENVHSHRLHSLPGINNNNTSSKRATGLQSSRTMPAGVLRQYNDSTSSVSIRRLAPWPTQTTEPAQTSQISFGIESVPFPTFNGPSSTSTFPSLPDPTPPRVGDTTMHNICSDEYSKLDDGFLEPILNTFDWTAGNGEFDFDWDFNIDATSDNITSLDD
ncbi:uncharacterized protein PG998_006385 [Apiospora kogelbergensis]|uniref:uncharacterized protein n=1 Tax=Apiospora kogelbergensis TaxID=1337665 RepID=UPI0031306A5D